MANSTVYPFGPGGQLPSNIGIINDLVTGGVDKALSAQMGVEINQLLSLKLGFLNTVEEGLFFIDEELNIGAKITNEGLAAFNMITIEDL